MFVCGGEGGERGGGRYEHTQTDQITPLALHMKTVIRGLEDRLLRGLQDSQEVDRKWCLGCCVL